MLRGILGVMVALFALAPFATGDGEPSSAPSFSLMTLPKNGGEPNLEVARDGTVYVVHPDWPGSHLYRRAPGAAAFEDLGRPNLGYGGGDEDVAVGPNGLVALAGMYWEFGALGVTPSGWCTSITVSRDGGDTWEPTVRGICAANGVDRPYVEIDETGGIWVLQHAHCCLGQHSVHYSADGVTFAPTGLSSAIAGFPGNIVAAHGRLYAASSCDGPSVCVVSTATTLPQPMWVPAAPIRTPAGLPGLAHTTTAIDDAGNLYLAWSELASGRVHVKVARSTDLGLTWSTPERVSEGNAATFPWIVAGADGHVAVAWYEADVAGNPNTVPASASWNVRLASRSSWDGSWERARVSATPNHVGPLCMNGAGCGGIDRDLLDYFELAIGPDGTMHVVWADDVVWRVQYAQQIAGAKLR